jgi:DNA primase catalytic subunit
MFRFRFPRGLKPTSLSDRRRFYSEEFDLKSVNDFLGWRDVTKTPFAVIVGRHSNIYLPEYESIKNKAVIIDKHEGLEDVLNYILQYLPEGVYYDRNIYSNPLECEKCGSYKDCWDCSNFLGQELAFDIDPENVYCPYHGSIKDKMERGQGLSFCMIEFKRVRKLTINLIQELEKEFCKIIAVFSGRGFHIHILDENAVELGKKEREKIAKKYERFAIDPWVTTGEMRLIRLPFSLNGLVSRLCTPVSFEEIKSFDPRRMAIPRFLFSQL